MQHSKAYLQQEKRPRVTEREFYSTLFDQYVIVGIDFTPYIQGDGYNTEDVPEDMDIMYVYDAITMLDIDWEDVYDEVMKEVQQDIREAGNRDRY